MIKWKYDQIPCEYTYRCVETVGKPSMNICEYDWIWSFGTFWKCGIPKSPLVSIRFNTKMVEFFLDDHHLRETSKWQKITTRWLSSPVNHEDKQGKNLRNFRHADSETFQSFINFSVRQIASPDSTLAIIWNTPSKHLSASSCCHTSWQDVLAWRAKKNLAPNAKAPQHVPHTRPTMAAGADRGACRESGDSQSEDPDSALYLLCI